MLSDEVNGNEVVEDNVEDVDGNVSDEGSKEESAFDIFNQGLKDMDDDNQQEESDGNSEGEELDEKPAGDDKELEDAPKEDSEESSEDEYEIPDDQTDAARLLGLTDEQIVKLAEDNPDVLKKMAANYKRDSLEEPVKSEEPKTEPVEKKEPELEKHMEMDFDDMDPDMAKVMSKIVSAHNRLIDKHNEEVKKNVRIDELSEAIKARDIQDFNNSVDKMFDGLSDNMPEIGNSRELDVETTKLRQELFGIANVIQKTRGLSLNDAIDDAAFMWKMAQTDLDELEKKVSSKLKVKLIKNKKRMTSRPGGKKTEQKFETSRDAAKDELSKGMEELLD